MGTSEPKRELRRTIAKRPIQPTYVYVLKHPVRAIAPFLFKTCQRITAKTINK